VSKSEAEPSSPHVLLNGRILDPAEACISPFDRGFLYGDGFFETTRVVAGVPLFLDRHLGRLSASCRDTGFEREVAASDLKEAVRRLIEVNGVREGYLRITVSRGQYSGRLADLSAESPTVLVEARPMELPSLESPPPLTLAKSPYGRDERSPLARHKSLSYQLNVLALAEGRRRGADEVFFLNSRGCLAEGAITNLFLVSRGMVQTPDIACGLLPGVTRQMVLEICRDQGIQAEVGVYGEDALAAADEVFCTNSLRGVVAVSKILEWPHKPLAEHLLTARLQAAYAGLVRNFCNTACGPR